MLNFNILLPVSFFLLSLNLWSQPTGNEQLALDIYDIVNSDTLFISRKTPFIPMHEEKVKLDFEGRKLKMLKTSFIQKEVHFKNYQLIDKSASHNPGFSKMIYDSLLSTEITGENKSLQIIRDKKDTMNLELLGLAGHQYVKVPFKIGSYKIVIDEKAVNKKCHELLPNVNVNNMSYQNISPYYLERHIVSKDKLESTYNILCQYVKTNHAVENNAVKTKIGDLKKVSVGSFVIESSLYQNSIEHIESLDMSSEQKVSIIHFNTLYFTVTDTVRKKLLLDSVLVISDINHFDSEKCISYAYTREKGIYRFNLVVTTSFYEPKNFFTYLQEKDQFVYDLNTNAQMNKGRVVDGNFIFEVTRKTVPIDNGPYVPRIEEYWNYKVNNILSNKIVMDLDVPFNSNQLKGEDSIQLIDVNFDNYPDLHISAQIPQWNVYYVYNLEKDTLVYEPYINTLENLSIDWHESLVTGEMITPIVNIDQNDVQRESTEFIKEEYRFEGLGLKDVTRITSKCGNDGACVVKKTEKGIYKNQRLKIITTE